MPSLTGVEKAERQILRALFSSDWRSYVTSRVRPELLITVQGREVFELASGLPVGEDGEIDAARFLREVLSMEEEREAAELALLRSRTEPSGSDIEIYADVLSFDEHPAYSSNSPDPTESDDSNRVIGATNFNSSAMSRYQGGQSASRTSNLIREVLEDSRSVMSNEPLNEAALDDCIRRLQSHREEQAIRELTELLGRNDLAPDDRQNYIRQYHAMKRQSRGSPQTVEDDNG